MRTGSQLLSVTLLISSLGAAAQAPDDDFQMGTLPTPKFSHDAKLSLIVGHLATAHPIGSFPCPKDYICLDGVWDDTFADMKTQLGPPIDPHAHIRSVHDAGLAGHPLVAYVVEPDNDGQLWAIDLRVVHNRRACFDRSLADKWPELASNRRARHSDGEVCFGLK